jgi:protein-S-isoprenylcysteine O-methyltransferase Ste14
VNETGKPNEPAAYEARFSPKLIRAERRPGFKSGLVMALLSCVPFIDAAIATHNHEQVNLGSSANTFFVPPWVAVGFGLILISIGCALIYVSIRKAKT